MLSYCHFEILNNFIFNPYFCKQSLTGQLGAWCPDFLVHTMQAANNFWQGGLKTFRVLPLWVGKPWESGGVINLPTTIPVQREGVWTGSVLGTPFLPLSKVLSLSYICLFWSAWDTLGGWRYPQHPQWGRAIGKTLYCTLTPHELNAFIFTFKSSIEQY